MSKETEDLFWCKSKLAVSEGWDFELIPEIEITGNAEQGILWLFNKSYL